MGSQSVLYNSNTSSPTNTSFNKDELIQHFSKCKFKAKEFIFKAGDKNKKVFFIESGRVKIGSYTPNGRAITKMLIFKGELFGELALTKVDTNEYFAQAIEDVELNVIEAKTLNRIIRINPKLQLFIMTQMSERFLQAEKKVESLMIKSSRIRIIEFLHNLAKKIGQQVGYEILVRGFMSHREIGDLTSTSRQTVTTTLNELRRKNLLIFNRKRLLIRDMDALILEAKE